MSPEESTTRDKILRAAVRLLEKNVPDAITTRQIAAEAEVNIAAINYHFQTKERLIDEAAYEFSRASFESGIQILNDKELDPAERLRRFLRGYAFGLVEFRAATRTIFASILTTEQSGGRYVELSRRLFEGVKELLREVSGEQDQTIIARKTLIAFSGTIFPFLYRNLFGDVGNLRYSEQDERDQYIDQLLQVLGAERNHHA